MEIIKRLQIQIKKSRDNSCHHNNSKSLFLVVIMFLVFLIYAIFFINKFAKNNEENFVAVKVNEMLKISPTRSLTLSNLVYSQSQNIIELEFDYEKGDISNNGLLFAGFTDSKNNTKTKTEIVIQEIDYVVVRFTLQDEDFTHLNVYSRGSSDNSEDTKFTVGKNQLSVVSEINNKSIEVYYIDKYERKIDSAKKQCLENNQLIDDNKEMINHIEDEIILLKETLEFKPASESVATQEQIILYENEVKKIKREIADLEKQNKACEKQILDLNKLINKLKEK